MASLKPLISDETGKRIAIALEEMGSGGGSVDVATLTFTGASNAVYNGKTPVTVNIPTGGSGGSQYTSGRVVYVNPKMTAAQINAEITKLENAGGGEVYFDAGEYLLTESIVIGGAVNLRGCGEKNTVLKASPTNFTAKASTYLDVSVIPNVTKDSTFRSVIYIKETAKFFTIEKMTIEGSRWTQNGTAGFSMSKTTATAGADFGIFINYCDSDRLGTVLAAGGVYDWGSYGNESSKKITVADINRFSHIRNITVSGCDCGIYTGATMYTYISYINLLYNGCGGVFRLTDSQVDHIIVNGSAFEGLRYLGGNNVVSNIRLTVCGLLAGTMTSLFTDGKEWLYNNPHDTYALNIIQSQRDSWANIDIQDNMYKPIVISAYDSSFTTVVVDGSGYYNPDSPGTNTTVAYANGIDVIAMTNCMLNANIVQYNNKNIVGVQAIPQPIYVYPLAATNSAFINAGQFENNYGIINWTKKSVINKKSCVNDKIVVASTGVELTSTQFKNLAV